MKFISNIVNSDAASWVQAVAAVLALFFSLYSIVLSKKAIKVSSTTMLLPTEMNFKLNTYDSFTVDLYNTGPGIAYDIKVSAYEIIAYKDKGKKGTWREHQVIFAEGDSVIQANKSARMTFPKLDIFYFHHKRPVVIEFKTADGKRHIAYWNYLMGESKKQRIVRMTSREVFSYKYIKKFKIDKV